MPLQSTGSKLLFKIDHTENCILNLKKNIIMKNNTSVEEWKWYFDQLSFTTLTKTNTELNEAILFRIAINVTKKQWVASFSKTENIIATH